MIIGIARVIYFFGPVLCLATVVLPKRPRLAWYFWAAAAAIASIYWIAFFSAKEDGAVETSVIPLAIWTPLLITTLIAGLTRNRWLGIHSSPAISQIITILICIAPSILSYFLIA